jgi:hypothetical protein
MALARCAGLPFFRKNLIVFALGLAARYGADPLALEKFGGLAFMGSQRDGLPMGEIVP